MKKWQYVSIVALVVVVFGLVVLARWLRPYDLATEQARARAAGIPLTAAEVGIPKPPASQDAYPLWVALEPDLKKSTAREDALLTTVENTTGSLSGGSLAAARELAVLEAGKDTRIREAASRPAMYWPVTYDVPYSFRTAASMREAAKHMARATRLLSAERRYREAAEAAGVGLKVAKQAAAGPTIINALVGIAVDAIALDGMSTMLRQAGPNAEATAAVRSVLANNPPGYDIVFAMRGEVVMSMNGLDHAVALGSPFTWRMAGPPTGAWAQFLKLRPPSGLWRYFSIDPSKAAYLHWMMPMMEAARKPNPARVPAMEAVSREVNALPRWNPTYIPVQSFMEVVPQFAARAREEDARRAVLTAAAAVLEYRARHGAYPARLSDAVAKPPPDPFTGRPIVYQRTTSGFVVRTGAPASALVGSAASRGLEFRYP